MELIYARLFIGLCVIAMFIAALSIDKVVAHFAAKRKAAHERGLAALKPHQRTWLNGYGRYL